jgi:hypothetical protein
MPWENGCRKLPNKKTVNMLKAMQGARMENVVLHGR